MNNKQDYTEQPFNLETALKHPEWVRTRDGREIDFVKEYPERLGNYKIVAVLKNGDIQSYNYEGLHKAGEKRDYDLILRVPYKIVFVVLQSNGDAKWYENEVLANNIVATKNGIACVPVKIPAIC